MAEGHGRSERVGDQIHRELAQILQFEVKDPRVGMVSLNEVRVSRDLGYADVYFTCVEPDADVSAVEAVLGKAVGYLRTTLASRMQLRVVPRLRFHYDQSVQHGRKLSSLIEAAVESDRDRHQRHDGDAGE